MQVIRFAIIVGHSLSLAVFAGSVLAGDVRTWKSQSGAQAEASFVRVSGGGGILQTEDGKQLLIPRSELSPNDESYLKRVLYIPQTITVSFEANRTLGDVVYMESAQSKERLTGSSVDSQKRNTNQSEISARASQPDTLKFRVMSKDDGTWGDDSTWNVIRAERIGHNIAGNIENPDEIRNTDGVFIRVVFKIGNDTKSDQFFTTPLIVDDKDREYSVIDDNRYYIPKNIADPYLNKIPPGFSRTYCTIYEIPKDSSRILLQATTLQTYDLGGNGTYIPMGRKMIALDLQQTE